MEKRNLRILKREGIAKDKIKRVMKLKRKKIIILKLKKIIQINGQ